MEFECPSMANTSSDMHKATGEEEGLEGVWLGPRQFLYRHKSMAAPEHPKVCGMCDGCSAWDGGNEVMLESAGVISRAFVCGCCIVLSLLLLLPGTGASASSFDEDVATPSDVTVAIWKAGHYEGIVQEQLASMNLAQSGVVTELDMTESSQVVITAESSFASLTYSEKVSVLACCQAGKTIIVIGGGDSLLALLGKPGNTLDSSVKVERSRVCFDVNTSEIISKVVESSEVLKMDNMITYGVRMNEDGTGGEVTYESSKSTRGVKEALAYVLDWATERSHIRESADSATLRSLLTTAVEEQMVDESEILLDGEDLTGSDWVADVQWLSEETRGPSANEPTTLDAKMLTKWWKLTDIYSDKDYYLIDVRTDTYISDFNCNLDEIGYYLTHRYNTIDIDYYDDAFHAGHWLEYGPCTDTSDSVTYSYSIGGSVGTASAGVDFGVSRSATKPAVKVFASYSTGDEWIKWDEEFRGPDLWLWPYITPPADASHGAYYTYHSVIGAYGGGESSTPNGMRAWVQNQYEVVRVHDYIVAAGMAFGDWEVYTFPSTDVAECGINYGKPALLSPLNGATSVATLVTADWTNYPTGCRQWYMEDWSSTWNEGWYCLKSEHKIYGGIGNTVYWRVYAQDPNTGIWSVPTTTWHFTTQTWIPCILEGTQITMDDGSTMAIEKLKAGMSVMAYDVDQGCLTSATITAVDQHWTDSILTINHGRLSLTPYGHPIYARSDDFVGWVFNAVDLEVGWELFEPMTGEWVEITHLHVDTGKYRVVDLNVAYPDDFIANGLLVHNKPIRG